MNGFFGRFLKKEGVAYLETAQLSGFGFFFLETPSFLSFIVAREGIETNCGGWSLLQKPEILSGLRLFRLVVTDKGFISFAAY